MDATRREMLARTFDAVYQQEIVVTQQVHHVGMWNLFKIGRIPGTNFIIQAEFVKSIGGWKNGALTEDTDISFKIIPAEDSIALAYQLSKPSNRARDLAKLTICNGNVRQGNYELYFLTQALIRKSKLAGKSEVFNYSCIFFWFNAALSYQT